MHKYIQRTLLVLGISIGIGAIRQTELRQNDYPEPTKVILDEIQAGNTSNTMANYIKYLATAEGMASIIDFMKNTAGMQEVIVNVTSLNSDGGSTLEAYFYHNEILNLTPTIQPITEYDKNKVYEVIFRFDSSYFTRISIDSLNDLITELNSISGITTIENNIFTFAEYNCKYTTTKEFIAERFSESEAVNISPTEQDTNFMIIEEDKNSKSLWIENPVEGFVYREVYPNNANINNEAILNQVTDSAFEFGESECR